MFKKMKDYVCKSICFGLIYDLYPYVTVTVKERPNWIYKIWKVFNRDKIDRKVWEKYKCVQETLNEIDRVYGH